MALIDTYRKSKLTKEKERSKLVLDKAKEYLKIAMLNKKAQAARDAIKRASTASTINTKLNEINKCTTDIAIITKKIADIEAKIVNKDKEITGYQIKIDKEQTSLDKKRETAETKFKKDQDRSLRDIGKTLTNHNTLHLQTQREIRALKDIPQKITVLFLASNPLDLTQLRLDEEARAIANMIRQSKYRDSVQFESRWALQPMDLLQAINELNPTIVHFSGHGSDNDEIAFQDQNGNMKLVTKEAIVQTMKASVENIRLVFFNTCYSKNQAGAISEFVEATIGMNTSIGDDAARVFSSQFYSSIGFGHSVGKAFQQAKALVMMEGINEENTPELFIRSGLDVNEIILVNPEQR
ncbi:CHAT domain-containing protein [Chryseobacterium joostei]|uniref:CHAT domain-containing protein n=1 Tax=Chryseobacterium joostei TaxID=112234 RepID=UPI0023F20D44|nr:CHAT domain-containing protein [Chryseobacterium joostei]